MDLQRLIGQLCVPLGVSSSSLWAYAFFFALVCSVTRFITGVKYHLARAKKDALEKRPASIPYWVPFVGSLVSFLIDVEKTCIKGW